MPTQTKTKTKTKNQTDKNNGHPAVTTSGAIFDFSAAQYMPTDLFTASSSLPETDDNATEQALQKIHNQANSMRIALANLGLGGLILDGETLAMRNRIKSAKNLVLEGELAIEGVRLEQVSARHDIESAKLQGLQLDAQGYQQMLPLQQQAWQLRLEGLSVDVAAGRAMLEQKRETLRSRFPDIQFDAPPQIPLPSAKK